MPGGGSGRSLVIRRSAFTILGLLIAAWPIVECIDLVFGYDVTLVFQPYTQAERDQWRAVRDPKDDVAEIYGHPAPGRDARVWLWRRGADPRLVRPAEEPARYLLLVEDGVAHVVQFGGIRNVAALITLFGALTLGLMYTRARLSPLDR